MKSDSVKKYRAKHLQEVRVAIRAAEELLSELRFQYKKVSQWIDFGDGSKQRDLSALARDIENTATELYSLEKYKAQLEAFQKAGAKKAKVSNFAGS